MAYVRKTTRPVRKNAGQVRKSYKKRSGSPARGKSSPRKMKAPIAMGRTMMRKEPSKCEKALMNGTLQKTRQGKLVRVYRSKTGKVVKAYCASNLQRRGAMGAVNGNRLRNYVKGGAVRVSKKVAGMRKAASKCEKAYRNGSLKTGSKGKLYRMATTKTGGRRKVYCNANLARRGVNASRYQMSATKLPNIANRLRVVSPSRSGSASTTASNVELANMLARALNMTPVFAARRTPTPKSPARKTPTPKSPVRKTPSPDLESRLRKNGFGKFSKRVAAALRANPQRKASNFSKQTGKLKVNVLRAEKSKKSKK